MVNLPWMLRSDDRAAKYVVNEKDVVQIEIDKKAKSDVNTAKETNVRAKELIITPQKAHPDGIAEWKRHQMERVLIDAGLLEDYDATEGGRHYEKKEKDDICSYITYFMMLFLVCVFMVSVMYLVAKSAVLQFDFQSNEEQPLEGSGYGSIHNE